MPCSSHFFWSAASGVSDLNFSTPSTLTMAIEPPPVVEPHRFALTVTLLPSLVSMVKPIDAKSVNSLPDGPLSVSICPRAKQRAE